MRSAVPAGRPNAETTLPVPKAQNVKAQESVPILENCEPQGASGLLIESFNPEPQATASPESVACGSGLNN